jgi:hypothetical protein
MGQCSSTNKLRQGAVHPERDQVTTIAGRPPPHNRHLAITNERRTTKKKPVIAATPLRRQKVATIDYTPIVQSEKDRYKYSCPLCFCYFADTILTTSCCCNYTCYTCALDHSKNHGVDKKSKQLPERLNGVPCPHCNTANVQFKYVAAEDKVRSYDTSPATKLRMNGGDLNTPSKILQIVDTKRNGPEVDSSSEEENSPKREDVREEA